MFVVDDDATVVASLRVLLESVGYAVRGYLSAFEYLEAYDPAQPGCLIVDERMPGMSGHALHEELVRRGNAVPIIMYSGYLDVTTAVAAMRRGAVTVLVKPCREDAILDAVAEALARDAFARKQAELRSRVAAKLSILTQRQRQVMKLLLQGKSARWIAGELRITLRTAEVHRARVLHIMGVGSVVELAGLLSQARTI